MNLDTLPALVRRRTSRLISCLEKLLFDFVENALG